jgi:hypothetical protein
VKLGSNKTADDCHRANTEQILTQLFYEIIAPAEFMYHQARRCKRITNAASGQRCKETTVTAVNVQPTQLPDMKTGVKI